MRRRQRRPALAASVVTCIAHVEKVKIVERSSYRRVLGNASGGRLAGDALVSSSSDPHTAECLTTGMGISTGIRASMPESRETVLRPASGGGLRIVIHASKLDSFVQLAITKRS